MCVGQSVWLSSLRVCSLQGLEGRRVLTDSCQSRLHPHLQPQENSEDPDTHSDSLTADTHTTDTHTDSITADTHTADTHTDSITADTHTDSLTADTHTADTHTADTHTDSITADTHSADTHLRSGTASGSGPAVRVKCSTLISFKVLETRNNSFVLFYIAFCVLKKR